VWTEFLCILLTIFGYKRLKEFLQINHYIVISKAGTQHSQIYLAKPPPPCSLFVLVVVTLCIVQNENKVRAETLDDAALYRFSLSSKEVKIKSQIFV
jgi:hypothetical protein